jgi:hypothetical protein
MVTRIGKILLIVSYVSIGYLRAAESSSSLELEVFSIDREPLNSVAVGIPFIIQVRLKNQDTSELPMIKGLEHVEIIKQTGALSTININGTTTKEKIIIFVVRARKPGVFTFGPASLTTPQAMASNIVSLSVTKEATQSSTEAHYEFIIDQKELFVGEKVPITLRFSYTHPTLRLRGLEEPKIEGLRFEFAKEMVRKEVHHNGAPYLVQEVQGFLYPEKSGSFFIPTLWAEYSVGRGSPFSASLIKTGYSNELTLQVYPLPPTEKIVHGIGRFTHFYTTLSHHTVKQGEGVAFSLIVEGSGNVEDAKAPVLTLPEGLLYYPSKSTIEGKGPLYTKRFDYSIQGLEPGDFLISEQAFTYFDPQKRIYRTLSSEPLWLKVEPAPYKPVSLTMGEPVAEVSEDTVFSKIRRYQPKENRGLSFWLFAFLMAAPGLVLLWQIVGMLVHVLHKKRRVHRIFKEARKRLYELKKDRTYKELYPLVQRTLADYCKRDSLTEQEIMEIPSLFSCSREQQAEWRVFIQELLACTAYAPKEHLCDSDLFRQTEIWLTLFASSKKLKKAYLFVCVFVSLVHTVKAEQSDTYVQTVKELRNVQRRAQKEDVLKIDTFVDELKESAKTSTHKRYSPFIMSFYSVFLALPWMVWQIFFIALWWALLFCGSLVSMRYRILLLALFISAGLVVLGGMYVRDGEWALVKKPQVTMYIGPDTEYPVKVTLFFLEEVYPLKNKERWYYVWSPLGSGWIEKENVELMHT